MATIGTARGHASSAAHARGLRALVGEGDRIMALTLPFAAVGVVANVLWPWVFRVHAGTAGAIAGAACVAIGAPIWIVSVAQILASVPKGKLVTRGPFALMLHPIYTSVALLVIPGCGLLFGSWLGFAIGLVVYLASRRYAPREERELAARFGDEYAAYRKRVLLPWL